MKRIIIGGTNSGCGKTTVTCAVLQALVNRKMQVASFKCGPDYIDPMFHKKILGTSAFNLDSFFCDDDTLKYLLYENSRAADISVIEGVMGFYDGANGRGSAYSVSQVTETPAVIVIDCKGMSDSIGAVMKGFLEYKKPNNIVGFIFDRLPEKLADKAEYLCHELGTEYFGFIPQTDMVFESRHLGLVTADEISDIKTKLYQLGELAEKTLKLDRLIKFAERSFPNYTPPPLPKAKYKTVIAFSKDSAFCFIYADNISLLQKLGCEIEYFSPLYDEAVPENADGIILCGGYPELYAERLAENKSMLESIRQRIISGIPAIAECGGFMYLHKTMEDTDGNEHRLVGAIDGKVYKTPKLRRFGYVKMTAERDNILCGKGASFHAHEFHYWDSTSCGEAFTAEKADGRSWKCVHANENLYAGFPHLYFYSDIDTAANFVQKCAEYKHSKEKN